ncbi:hypothetical protein TVAG_160830 [Trichomonas vaginalis G3]|uniref:Uncharacterized protein n=1 Tax=Trichomonas vaginalis (strain ATCC PRA-98 / G3) TaxID=412133 RepID=A2E4T8_TRIV3|nr:hypothetical protein TVAGG3_0227820 [Trichomonas vaginalis G3]EAY12277.1 hypothetical protein TVAG_160830 [Trichomonas vaginalis G3]KAI5552393.1 hypothetical protein TVAGG3_0227820 [Trichomonas vaginalis G3]|eukprot:XP_001324500.1 hypothetical protein [Trichomonas vaginalis G3]
MSEGDQKKALIEKIIKQRNEISRIKEVGNRDFDILKKKLAEARDQKQKLIDHDYSILEGIENEKAKKVLQLAKDTEKLSEEHDLLVKQNKKSVDSKKGIEDGMITFEDTIKNQLGLSSTNEIVPKLKSLKELPKKKFELQRKLAEMNDDTQNDIAIENGPNEKVRQEMRAELESLARNSRSSNPELSHLLAALHNTLFRINGNPNEEYFEAHARSVVYQSRAYGKSVQTTDQLPVRETKNNPPNPRNF